MTANVEPALAGRYQLGDLLGTGGMADVHRAVDLLLGREVAIKLLRPRAGDTSAEARFRSEARLLAAISDPHVITILDVSSPGVSPPYLVMEIIEGPSLSQRLREAGPMDEAAMRALGVQLARGLQAAHQRGIVHRDVKPDNVLLRSDETAILTDFGISRLQDDDSHQTAAGMVIGSPAYLAPEQVSGVPLTAAVDIYALGLVLLECYTGSRAYPGPPVEAALSRLGASPAIPVSLPREVRELLVSMTALEPADRPTAEQVAQVLDPTEPGSSVPAALPAEVHTEEFRLPADVAVAVSGHTAATMLMPRRRRGTVLTGVATAAALVAFWLVGSAVGTDSDGGGTNQDEPSSPATPVADPPATDVTPSPSLTAEVEVANDSGGGDPGPASTKAPAAGGGPEKAKPAKGKKQGGKGGGKGPG